MQANKNYAKSATVLSAFALALILVFGIIGSVGIVNLNQKLKDFDVDEQAIADAIVAGIVIPGYPDMPEYDVEKLDELWEGVYDTQIGELERDAFIASVNQFFEDNNWDEHTDFTFDDSGFSEINTLFDSLELLGDDVPPFEENDELFEFLEGEYEDVTDVLFIREYKDKREFNVINLGLDDEDDREVELSGVIRVKVTYDDGNEDYMDKVYINSVVTSDDGELEAEVTYSL